MYRCSDEIKKMVKERNISHICSNISKKKRKKEKEVPIF